MGRGTDAGSCRGVLRVLAEADGSAVRRCVRAGVVGCDPLGFAAGKWSDRPVAGGSQMPDAARWPWVGPNRGGDIRPRTDEELLPVLWICWPR